MKLIVNLTLLLILISGDFFKVAKVVIQIILFLPIMTKQLGNLE
jgi:hypothetical protein